MEKSNTPFSPVVSSAAPARRLWNFLVRQEPCQDIFIRAIFGKHKLSTSEATAATASSSASVVDGSTPGANETHHNPTNQYNNINLPEPVRIIHKEQESIFAFCLNLVNPGLLALATPREVQEMDISLLLDSPNWMEDECEFDIMNLNKDIETLPASSFLVIQTSADKYVYHMLNILLFKLNHIPYNPLPRHVNNQNMNNVQNYSTPATPQPGIAGQSGRGASVVSYSIH